MYGSPSILLQVTQSSLLKVQDPLPEDTPPGQLPTFKQVLDLVVGLVQSTGVFGKVSGHVLSKLAAKSRQDS